MNRSHATALFIAFLYFGIGIGTAPASAHEKDHAPQRKTSPAKDDEGFEIVSTEPSKKMLESMNALYKKMVKPIFQAKCFDCHSSGSELPWYANIPGPKGLITKDIEEAKKHMDMSSDLPFAGHGRVKDDIEAIGRVLESNSMPPFRYKLLHWSSGLSETEKDIIRTWIWKSKVILQPQIKTRKDTSHEPKTNSDCCDLDLPAPKRIDGASR